MLDGVHLITEGEPVFQEARAPTPDELQGFLARIIARLMRMLTRLGYLIEEEGVRYIAGIDTDNLLASMRAASCIYRIALGPRAGQKVLSLRTLLMHLPAREVIGAKTSLTMTTTTATRS